MLPINNRIKELLQKRKNEETFRFLKILPEGIDFISNDYLGLASNIEFQNRLLTSVNEKPYFLSGATGSRLISGNSLHTTVVEQFIADAHQTESALLFSTGFSANLALLSSVPKRGDIILMDECVHRSVRDGSRLSNAHCYKFKHNNLEHLEELLKKFKGTLFVVIESLYSMEGDRAPIEEIIALTNRYRAALIVDEAHAFGVFGYGLISEKKLQSNVFATIITYGKAMGLHGASILGSKLLIAYLVNYASPFIYTTAMNDWHAMSIKIGYEFISQKLHLALMLQKQIEIFNACRIPTISDKTSPIQILNIPGKTAAKNLQKKLAKNNLLTFAVVAPTVKPEHERLRICLHAFNSDTEIEQLSQIIHSSI